VGPSLSGEAKANMQKFFGSFFQKRTSSSLPPHPSRNDEVFMAPLAMS
jgi:hypothetical protein